MQKLATGMALVLAGVAPAQAQPHVWIDTGVEVILNERNEATGTAPAGPAMTSVRFVSWETWGWIRTGTERSPPRTRRG
jgi:hypothetical protein